MNKVKITIITETILLIIFFCTSCFLLHNNINKEKENTKIEEKLDSCLIEKDGLTTANESLTVENEELTKQNNTLNEENEKLRKK